MRTDASPQDLLITQISHFLV